MTGKLSFGYLYDFRNPPQWHRDWTQLYGEILDFVAWSETAGFEGAWVPEHHGASDGYCPSPNVILAAIAARTKRLRLGSGVALAPLHHPVRFAEECALLDILCGGRLEMHLAIGYRRRETEAYGVDFTRRGALFDEFLQIVQPLWAGETVTFDGRFFQVKEARITPPPPRGRIPLFIGGFAEKALARVARHADGYFGNPECSDLYRRQLELAGKDPASARIRFQALFTVVARDPEAARDALAPWFHHVNNSYGEWLHEDNASAIAEPLKPQTLDEFRHSGTLDVITPEEAVERFRALRDRHGVEHVSFMLPPGLPPAEFMPYAELIAKEVMPAFA